MVADGGNLSGHRTWRERREFWDANEVAFIAGHQDALIALTAIVLLLFLVNLLSIQGLHRKAIGSILTFGDITSTGAEVPYVFLDLSP